MTAIYDPFGDTPTEVDLDVFELNSEMPVGILSPSSISCYLRCAEQFRREYVLGEKRKPGAWGASGTAFHEARHAILALQRDQGREASEQEVQAAYAKAWASATSEEIDWRGDKPEDIQNAGWKMTLLYHRELGKDIRPTVMEKGVKGYVDGVPVPVYGKVDVIDRGEEVIDTKTGKQLFHKVRPEHFIQGCIYVRLTGLPIRWHSVSQKPAATTSDVLRLVPRPKVLAAAERFVRNAYAGIVWHLRTVGRDAEWTGNGPAHGGCTYCSFRGRCAYVPD